MRKATTSSSFKSRRSRPMYSVRGDVKENDDAIKRNRNLYRIRRRKKRREKGSSELL